MPPSTHPTSPPRDDLFARPARRSRQSASSCGLAATATAIDGHEAILAAIGLFGLTIPEFAFSSSTSLARIRCVSIGVAIELADGEICGELASFLSLGELAEVDRSGGVHAYYTRMPEHVRTDWAGAVAMHHAGWRKGDVDLLVRPAALPRSLLTHFAADDAPELFGMGNSLRRHQQSLHQSQHRGPGRGGALPPRAGAPLSRLRTA